MYNTLYSLLLPNPDSPWRFGPMRYGFSKDSSDYNVIPERIHVLNEFIYATLPFKYEDYQTTDFSLVTGRCNDAPSKLDNSQTAHWIFGNPYTEALYPKSGFANLYALWQTYIDMVKGFQNWLQLEHIPTADELVGWSHYNYAYGKEHSFLDTDGRTKYIKTLLSPISMYNYNYESTYALGVVPSDPLTIIKVRYEGGSGRLYRIT